MLNKFRYILRRQQCRSIDNNDINMEQLEKMVGQGAILLDVRSPQEYNEGHLEGSILIPDYELRIKAEKMLKDKQQTIIAYCSSGIRSKKAQKMLKQMGYTQVYNLYQGLENY